jgi:hypothetical protein
MRPGSDCPGPLLPGIRIAHEEERRPVVGMRRPRLLAKHGHRRPQCFILRRSGNKHQRSLGGKITGSSLPSPPARRLGEDEGRQDRRKPLGQHGLPRADRLSGSPPRARADTRSPRSWQLPANDRRHAAAPLTSPTSGERTRLRRQTARDSQRPGWCVGRRGWLSLPLELTRSTKTRVTTLPRSEGSAISGLSWAPMPLTEPRACERWLPSSMQNSRGLARRAPSGKPSMRTRPETDRGGRGRPAKDGEPGAGATYL